MLPKSLGQFLQYLWAVVLFRYANDHHTLTEPEDEQQGYTLSPLKLGAEVRGIKLNGYIPSLLVDRIKSDVYKHQLLVFKDQGFIPADRHVQLVTWFGPPKVTFRMHPAQQHPKVFRVSNEFHLGNGNSVNLGWHIDGALPQTMTSTSMFHMLDIPTRATGDTWFVSLYKIVEDLPAHTCHMWERMYVLSDDQGAEIIKPLIYTHPFTKRRTMILYAGGTNQYMTDHGLPLNRRIPRNATGIIVAGMVRFLERNNGTDIYKHRWEPGDFIMVDNQAVAHKAPRDTNLPSQLIGLRVLHRASSDSLRRPVKEYDLNRACYTPQEP